MNVITKNMTNKRLDLLFCLFVVVVVVVLFGRFLSSLLIILTELYSGKRLVYSSSTANY